MEDAHEIHCPPGPSARFVSFAVYDGHGGDNVAIKASKYCMRSIMEEVRKCRGCRSDVAEMGAPCTRYPTV